MGRPGGVGADLCLQKSGLCFAVGEDEDGNKGLQLGSRSVRGRSLFFCTNLMMKFSQAKLWLSGNFLA